MSEQRAEWHEDETGDVIDPHAPLDVRVVDAVRVQEFPATSMTTGQAAFGLAGQVIQVVAGRPARVSVRITNRADAAALVWIGGTDQLTSGTGHELDPGESVAFEMNGSVYAVCDTDNAGRMDWLALNRDG